MWFDTWSDILRVVLVGPTAYVVLVVLLRTSGKRTLAKLNAFDLVVTVALGSTLSAIFVSSDVSLSEGAVALTVLALLQFLVATATSRLPASRDLVTAEPTLLLENGIMLDHALGQQRLTPQEMRQAIRGSGLGDVSAVAAIVLETDGTLSVIAANKAGNGSSLVDIERS